MIQTHLVKFGFKSFWSKQYRIDLTRLEMGQNWVQLVKKMILDLGRFIGIDPGIVSDWRINSTISSTRWLEGPNQATRLNLIMVQRVNSTRLLPCNVWTAHDEHSRIFRLHVWFTAGSNRDGICIVRFVMKNPTSWNDQIVF